jgi:hypothetical protein
MHFRYYQDQKGFLREYNQQRRADAFFSKMTRQFGSSIRSPDWTIPSSWV